jgi:type II secretory pathway component PulF
MYLQSEIPKPETTPEDYVFNLGEFLSENWFFLLGFLLTVAVVIFYSIYRNQQKK